MKHKIFSIFDSKAKAYLPPFFLHQEGMATRVFSDCITNKSHQFSKHPEDYTLFHIGTWDDGSSKITVQPPISMGNGVEFTESEIEMPPILKEVSNDE